MRALARNDYSAIAYFQAPRAGRISEPESRAIFEGWIGLWQTLALSMTRGAEVPLEIRFARAANQWKTETSFLSNPDEIRAARGFAELVDLGPKAIPLIIKEIQTHPSNWFDVLIAITREDPIPPEDAGDVDKMVAVWTEWARKRGII